MSTRRTCSGMARTMAGRIHLTISIADRFSFCGPGAWSPVSPAYPLFFRRHLTLRPMTTRLASPSALARLPPRSSSSRSPSRRLIPSPAAKEETLQLSPFTVSTQQDRGYLASNSVSATRVDTAIKDLPFTVNAFTEQFITDIGARDLQDIVKYAPGVTGAGREFVSGNTRFNIRGFDDQRPAAQRLRRGPPRRPGQHPARGGRKDRPPLSPTARSSPAAPSIISPGGSASAGSCNSARTSAPTSTCAPSST